MATKSWISTSSTDWSQAANWSPSGVPATGDDVYITGAGTADIDTGLAQSAVTLASLSIGGAFTGKIGSTTAYLAIGATLVTLGQQSQAGTTGTGSSRLKINFGSVQTTVQVFGTARTTADTGLEPVRLLGTHASNSLTVTSGKVGVATSAAGETSTFATVNATGSDAIVNLGAGVTLTTVVNNGGAITTTSGMTTLTCLSGTTTTRGTGAITTVNATGGTVNLWHRPSGTGITTLNWNGATLNLKGAPGSLTIGTTAIVRGGTASVFSASQVTWGTVTLDPTNGLSATMSLNS